MLKFLIASGILIIGLGGCASTMQDRAMTVASVASDLTKAPICCSGYASFPFETIVIPYESKFDIGRANPVFNFPHGKSYFRAFELPEYKQPYVIEVESRIARQGITTASSWMFYPVVMFLDKQFKPITVARDLPFEFDGRGWGTYGMSARIRVTSGSDPIKYVVIFTEPQFLSLAFKFRAYGALGSMSIVTPQSDDTSAVPFSYEGKVGLSVYLQPASPQPIIPPDAAR